MNKKYYLLSLMILLLSIQPFSLSAMEYKYEIKAKKMKLFWTLEKDQIHIKIAAKTTSWVSIGFDPEEAMKGANIIIGAVKNGAVKVEDHYGNRKRGHANDKKLGGENHVLNPSGTEIDGITTITFTLPLDTGDEYDKPISTTGTNQVILAYGKGKDSFKTFHPFKAVYEINFVTGENKKIK